MQSFLWILGTFMHVVGVVGVMIFIAGLVQIIKTNIIHQASHGQLLRHRSQRAVAKVLAEVLGVITLSPPVDEYARSHVGVHHRAAHIASILDEDTQWVGALGFKPGQSVASYWQQLFKSLFNPLLHGRLLLSRIGQNWRFGPDWRKVLFIGWWSAALMFAMHFELMWPLLLGYVLPITVLYQMAAMLHGISLHMHFSNPGGDKDNSWHARMSHARFVGEALPASHLTGLKRITAWIGFWLRLVFWHLPIRWLVLPGELATHSAHHWFASQADWTQAAYSYRDLKATVPTTWHREFWGLRQVLNAVFEGMSKAR